MRPHLRYLNYVLLHKWFVFREACRLGIPLLGIAHDLSKFYPSEWRPYVESFYGPKYPSVKDVHGDPRNWTRTKEDVRQDFDHAWLTHIHRNKHHHQWWVLREDDGGTKVLEMPDRYRREMVADWRGAGLAQGTPDCRAWYLAQRQRRRIILAPETRAWVEAELGVS